MACIQIWQKNYKGSRVLWGFLNNLSDAVGIVQLMVDGMRDGWECEFQVICGEESISMQHFIEIHNIKKRSFDER